MVSQAPARFASAAFSAEPTVPIRCAPSAFAHWQAISPTPPAVATVVMVVGGLFAVVIKLLPWLLLAVVGVWLYRAFRKPSAKDNPWLSR